MAELRDDFRLALDRVEFAQAVGLEPDPWQESLLRSHSKRFLLNVSRQAGKSTISGLIGLHRALYHPRSLVLFLSPSLRQSQELFKKALGFYRELGRPVPPESETALTLTLANGSRIISLPGSEGRIRGFSGVSLLIVDEAARVEDALYFSVRPMLAVSGGSLMMLSTPWGKRGAFFEEWTNGTGWQRFEVTAHDCPRISREFLEEEAKTLGPRWFRQEYECSFEETQDSVFDYETVEAAISDEVEPLFGGTKPSSGAAVTDAVRPLLLGGGAR